MTLENIVVFSDSPSDPGTALVQQNVDSTDNMIGRFTKWEGKFPRIKSRRDDNKHLILMIGKCQSATLNVQ